MNEPIRVYKRKPGKVKYFSDSRLWSVGPVPGDGRETCWPTWGEAMQWATMPSDERVKLIEEEDRMEGGW